jgi:uncharacterized integral membrane protein
MPGHNEVFHSLLRVNLASNMPALCPGSMIRYMIYLLTAIGLTPGGSSTVHIYTQTIHRTMQSTQTTHRTTLLTNWEECGPCPVFASYTLAFSLQLRKKHGKTQSG